MIPHPAPDLPDALCHRHPGLPPSAWMPRSHREHTLPLAQRSCLVLCPELAACAAWAERHRPTAGVWAGTLWGLGA